jgi:4-methyl-5(b-hydroxyethyl)-thiazole monophosphate biosynthesis
MMPTALVVLADGFEEMEAAAPIDLLRRAGVEVTVAGLNGPEVTGRNGMRLIADVAYAAVAGARFDLIVVPGGPAFVELRKSASLRQHLQEQASAGRAIAAICAGPTVLLDAGLLQGRSYTAHFSVRDELPGADASRAVVIDKGIITSQGAGTATAFGLALVEFLCGEETAAELAASICYKG